MSPGTPVRTFGGMDTPNHDKQSVLITGASSGIGLELARSFAQRGHRVVLVAPVAAELEAIAADFERDYDTEAIPHACDLNDEASIDALFRGIEERGLHIDILVNNAGLGQRGKFWEIPLERDAEMLRVNVAATIRLTKHFLPPMLSRGRGRILNTASVAGFEPGPGLAVYHATKAFLLSFSEALATELEGTGVTVTALCPGPTDTDFFEKADMVQTNAFQHGNVMGPREVAETGYEALMRGERVIVPGGLNKIMVAGRRFIPESVQASKNEKYYKSARLKKPRREPGEVAAKEADR